MKYNVRIGTPGKIIIFRNRPLRTPVILQKVTKEELDLILIKIRAEAIEDYGIEDYETKVKINVPDAIGKEIIVDGTNPESIKNPSSILDKLLVGDYAEES